MTSQTPKEILDSLHRLVPMQVAKAASVIEDDYMRALRDVRMYARQLDHVPDDIAEENDQTHKNDKDIAFKRVLYRQAGLFKLRREYLDNKTRLDNLKDEQKAAKKLREKFEADYQFGYQMMTKVAQIARERLDAIVMETLAYQAEK